MKKRQDQKQKSKGFRAGLAAFGITAVVYAVIFPLYRVADFILCGALALLAGKVISIMASGLDLTTHNKPSQPDPVAELPLSGNETADAVIARGQDMLRQIRAENAAIPDEKLSSQMDDLERLCVQIFRTVAEKPGKASQIRKFMNYYLPTTLKMLANYRTMDQRGVSATDMAQAHATLIRGMDVVLTACQKQLDTLYKDTLLDVTTDMEVLEQMLRRDGLSPDETPRVAAAPASVDIPRPAAKDEDFVSFYNQQNRSSK